MHMMQATHVAYNTLQYTFIGHICACASQSTVQSKVHGSGFELTLTLEQPIHSLPQGAALPHHNLPLPPQQPLDYYEILPRSPKTKCKGAKKGEIISPQRSEKEVQWEAVEKTAEWKTAGHRHKNPTSVPSISIL